MTILQALIAFVLAAGLLTVTPGLDTAVVLRASALEGRRAGAGAAAGIILGLMVWGAASAIGLTALLAASRLAYTALKWAGAAYLIGLGAMMLLKPKDGLPSGDAAQASGAGSWLRRGLLTNLLNPKVGVFYVAFLPQFTPHAVAAGPFIAGLVGVHVLLTGLWFAALIAATQPLGRILRQPRIARRMNRLTGLVFVGFGAKLAWSRT